MTSPNPNPDPRRDDVGREDERDTYLWNRDPADPDPLVRHLEHVLKVRRHRESPPWTGRLLLVSALISGTAAVTLSRSGLFGDSPAITPGYLDVPTVWEVEPTPEPRLRFADDGGVALGAGALQDAPASAPGRTHEEVPSSVSPSDASAVATAVEESATQLAIETGAEGAESTATE